MSHLKITLPAVILLGGFLVCSTSSYGKPEYTKATKKACAYCHVDSKAKPKELTDADLLEFYRANPRLFEEIKTDRIVIPQYKAFPPGGTLTPEQNAAGHAAMRKEAESIAARAALGTGLAQADALNGSVRVRDVTVELPNGATLLRGADLDLQPGHSVVISGRSGSGKSTLFRAIAGIWPFGHGRVERPLERCLFLPQRPYIPLGTLRHVVTYPHPSNLYSREAIVRALEDVGLASFVPRLDHDENWPQQLSGGEQQRVALARALLAKPDWLFLDEATASLDPSAESGLYHMLKERLPGTTIVSIAHRPSVAAFHERRLVFRREEGQSGELVPGEFVPAVGGDG